MLQKLIPRTLVVLILLVLCSCGPNDPNATPGFNRDTVREYMLERASTIDRRPVMIEEISPIQKVVLHGESLLTCAVAVRSDGSSGTALYYFVFSPEGTDYLSGTQALLERIEANGYKAIAGDIRTRNKGSGK
jgi:hypothetical protein